MCERLTRCLSVLRLAVILSVATCLLVFSPVFAQNENETVGFSSTHAFDGGYFGESIDTLNGNLNLTIPIGPTYQVNRNLSYQLKLYYNSRVWEFADTTGRSSKTRLWGENPMGLGFNLSFGRLYQDYRLVNGDVERRWFFVTQDGNRHDMGDQGDPYEANDTTYFNPETVRNGAGVVTGYRITNGTGIRYTLGRFVNIPAGAGGECQDCDWRDRMMSMGGWYVTLIEDLTTGSLGSDGTHPDRYPVWVEIQYETPTGPTPETSEEGYGQCISKVIDSANRELRFHNARLAEVPGDPGSRRVASIDIPKFSGTSVATPSFATYTFEHSFPLVTVPIYNNEASCLTCVPKVFVYDDKRNVIRLQTIILPGGYTMRFEYGNGSELSVRTLPLNQLLLDNNGRIQGARMEYSYTDYRYFRSEIRNGGETNGGKPITGGGFSVQGMTRQIVEKRLYLAGATAVNPSVTWQYYRQVPIPVPPFETFTNPPSVTLTTIQSDPPALNETVYYFHYSINPDHHIPSGPDSMADGSAPDWDDGLLFRTEYWEGRASEGRLLKVEETSSVPDILSGTWITKNNVRPYRTATTFVEDGGKQVAAENSEWDDQGHWKVTTETGYGMTAPRITRKQYFPRGLHNDSFDFVEVGDGINVISRSDYDYDAVGRLITVRDRKTAPSTPGTAMNVTPSEGDVLTTLLYDANGNVFQKTTSSIDSLSVPTISTHTTTYGYTSAGGYLQTKQLTGVSWKAIDWHRDVNTGLIYQSCDSAGVCTNYDYDDLGRIRKIIPTSPEFVSAIIYPSLKETTVWQSAGAATTPNTPCTTSENCIYSRYLYDEMARLIETQKRNYSGALIHQLTAYDALSNVRSKSEWSLESVSEPPKTQFSYINPTTGVYDPFGRVHRVTSPDSKITDTAYRGQDTTVTVQGISGPGGVSTNVSTTYGKDALGRLVEVSRPTSIDASTGQALTGNSASASYRYDLKDNLVQVDLIAPDFTHQARTFAYDALGHLIREDNPENGTIQYGAYDDLGNLRRKTDNAGNAFSMVYDVAGRLLQTKHGSVLLVQNTYDQVMDTNGDSFGASAGKLTKVESFADSTQQMLELTQKFYYSGLNGRPSGESTKFPEATPNYRTSLTYNSFGLVSSSVYPKDGTPRPVRSLQANYSNGFLRSLNDASDSPATEIVNDLQYNPAGGLSTILTVGNVRDSVTADSRNRPLRIQVDKINPVSGAPLVSYWDTGNYQYDGAGNIKEIGATGGTHFTFGYDEANRLVSANIEKGSRPPIISGSNPPVGDPTVYFQADYTLLFGYDPFGNLVRRDDGMTNSRRQFAVNPLTNRLMTATSCHLLDQCATPVNKGILYDTNGNVVQDEDHTLEVDARNRVLRVRNLSGGSLADESRYDPAGFRVMKRSENTGLTTFYIRDQAGQVLSEFTRPTSLTTDPIWRGDYVYAAGRVIAMTERDKPDPPAGLYVQSVTGCPTGGGQATVSVTLAWQRSLEADVTGYEVYRNATKISTTDVPVGTPSFPESILSGTTYNYQLKAKDPLASSDFSSDYRANFCHPVIPSAPTIQPAIASDGRVSIDWSVSTTTGANSVVGYHVLRAIQTGGSCPAPGAGFTDLNSIPQIGTNYVDVTVVNGTTYCYLVKARDTAAALSLPSNVVAATPLDWDAPATPRNLRAHTGCANSPVALVWDANTEPDLQRYTIYRNGSSDVTGAGSYSWDVTAASVAFPVIDDPLGGGTQAGQVFFYAIRAYDNRGNPSPLSLVLRVAMRNSGTPAPSNVAGVAGIGSVQLTWTHLSAHRFVVYRRPYGGSCAEFQQVFSGTLEPESTGSTDFNFEDLLAENFKAYEYAVSSLDTGGGNESFDSGTSPELVPAEAPQGLQQCWSPTNNGSAFQTIGVTWPHVSIVDTEYDAYVAAAAGRGYMAFVGYTTDQRTTFPVGSGPSTDWNNKIFLNIYPSQGNVQVKAVYKINDWKYCDSFKPAGATYCTGNFFQDRDSGHSDCGLYDSCLTLGRLHISPDYGGEYNPARYPSLVLSAPTWIHVPSWVSFAATQSDPDIAYPACSSLWPPRPENLRGSSVGPGEVLVEWDAPSGDQSQVSAYQVSFLAVEPKKPVERPVSAPRSVTLTGQSTCDGSYVYVDSIGPQRISSRRAGAWRLDQLFIPPRTELPGSIQLAPGASNGTIIASWTRPSGSICAMDHVEIRRTLGTSQPVITQLASTAGPLPLRQSYSDTGLVPGGDYSYEFRASYTYYKVTDEGWVSFEAWSNWSTPLVVRAPGGGGSVIVLKPAPPPVAPPVVPGAPGSATVSWTPPQSGPVPHGYRIHYWTDRDRRPRLWRPESFFTGTSASVTGLDLGRNYHFSVQAVRWNSSDGSPVYDLNGVPQLLESGDSATSTPFAPPLPADALKPPTGLSVEVGGSEGQLTVNWDQAPAPATKYFIEDVSDPNFTRRISYLDASGNPTNEVIPADPGRMSFSISGLHPRQLYRFVVISADASGNESAPSLSTSGYPLDMPPTDVRFLCIYCPTSLSTIQIKWQSAAAIPEVSHYVIARRKSNCSAASDPQVVFDHVPKTQTLLLETPPASDIGCTFTYSIAAVDKDGTYSRREHYASTPLDPSCHPSCMPDGNGDGDVWGFSCTHNCIVAVPHHPEITQGGLSDPQFSSPGMIAERTASYDDPDGQVCSAVFSTPLRFLAPAAIQQSESTSVMSRVLTGAAGGGSLNRDIGSPRGSMQPYRMIGTPEPGDQGGGNGGGGNYTPPSYRWRILHADHLGTPRIVTDSAGLVISEHAYLPFGEEVPPSNHNGVVNSSNNSHRFTGHERDSETGLDYMLARYYEAGLGRFLSVDPSFKVGKNLTNPQRWNRYTYSLNNPIKNFDPDGREYVNSTGKELADRIMSRNQNSNPPGSPTGQRIVGNVKGEKEQVTVTVSSKAAFELVDKNGKPVPKSGITVDPANAQLAQSGLAAQAQPGQTVAPVAGQYTPTATGADGSIGAGTITIFAGTKNFTAQGQNQTEAQFVESEFVHESGHAEGPDPSAKSETDIKNEQKQYEKESQPK